MPDTVDSARQSIPTSFGAPGCPCAGLLSLGGAFAPGDRGAGVYAFAEFANGPPADLGFVSAGGCKGRGEDLLPPG